MGRGDEMRKRKEEKEKWEQEQLLKKAEDAGLTFQDNGLPPPDDEDVYADPGIIKSLLSMIPGTQAYYEAQASEQEMDDLAKIRIEKTKANDLLAMAKMGKHEEALDKMMAETNNDFFYFNKLKERITKEGKYSYKEIDLNPFKDIGSKKNRLRKALRMQFNVLTTSDTLNLSATVEGANDKAAALKHQRALRNSPCSWRGKSKTGVFLQCLNSRHLHPRDTYKDELGNDVHEALTTCAYHAKFCVGDHPGDQEQKILIPNEEALCIECYVDSNQNKPTAMALDKCPGVGPVNTNASKISLQAEEKVDENLTEDSICNWKPTGHEMHTFLRGYKCGNKVYRDPETKVLQYTCAYHIKFCLRTHTSEATSVIEIPNEFGLCTNHHMVEHKDEPVKLKQPYPGMVRRVFKRNLLFKPGHWASPYWPPVGNVEVKHYVKPEYDDVVLLMFAMAAKSVRVL